jgi:hypothetical protein
VATLPRCSLISATGSVAAVSPALTGWTNDGAGPSGTSPVSGDFVVIIGTVAAASQTVTQTAGTGTWTIQASDNNAGPATMTVWVAYRIFNGTETTPTFSWATTARVTWTVVAFAPAAGQSLAVDVWAASQIDTVASTTHTANPATASGTDTSAILSGAVANAGDANPVTFSGPTGWTAIAANSEQVTGRAMSSGICYQASVTGTVTPGAQTIEGGTTTTTPTAANLYHVLIATIGAVTATGSMALAPLKMAGTGAGGNNTATGSMALAPLAMSGTGVVHVVASGGLALSPLKMAGTAAETFASTGSLKLAPLKMAGTGAGGNNTATGSMALAPLKMAGTGAETFTATGGLRLAPLAMSGTGVDGGNVTCSGGVELAPLKMRGLASNGKATATPGFVDDYRHRLGRRFRRRGW